MSNNIFVFNHVDHIEKCQYGIDDRIVDIEFPINEQQVRVHHDLFKISDPAPFLLKKIYITLKNGETLIFEENSILLISQQFIPHSHLNFLNDCLDLIDIKKTVILLGFNELHKSVIETYTLFLNFYFDQVIYIIDKTILNNEFITEHNVKFVYDILDNRIYSEYDNIDILYNHLYDINNNKLIKKISTFFTSQTITYRNGGALGDLIHGIYVIKLNYYLTGLSGDLYINPTNFRNKEAVYPDIYNMITSQIYINKFEIDYTDIKGTCNLDVAWGYVPTCNWLSLLCYIHHLPLLNMKWLQFNTSDNNKMIVINRSLRHNSDHFPWESIVKNNVCFFLTFDGTDYEQFAYKHLCTKLQVSNFDELMNVINNCHFYIGNQSAPLAIAYGLHKPCLAELYIHSSPYYKGLENYHNEYMWISDSQRNINDQVLKKYSITL